MVMIHMILTMVMGGSIMILSMIMGSLEQVAAGWGGQADWHEVTFDLSEYLGMDVIIQFVFGSDPAYSTPDDNSLTGFKVDDITVTDGQW